MINFFSEIFTLELLVQLNSLLNKDNSCFVKALELKKFLSHFGYITEMYVISGKDGFLKSQRGEFQRHFFLVYEKDNKKYVLDPYFSLALPYDTYFTKVFENKDLKVMKLSDYLDELKEKTQINV